MLFKYQLTEEHLLTVSYDTSSKTADVKLNGDFVFRFDDYSHLIRGDDVNLRELGLVRLKFVSEDQGFEIVFGSIHHRLSATHPKYQLRKITPALIIGISPTLIIFSLVIIYWTKTVGLSRSLDFWGFGGYMFIFYNIAAVVLILIAIYMSRTGNWMSIVIGISVFATNIILKLVAFYFLEMPPGALDYVLFILEIGVCGFLIKNVSIISTLKLHERSKGINEHLLDDPQDSLAE